MRQVRNVEREPITRGTLFRYQLKEVGGPTVGARTLRNARAHWLSGDPLQLDPDERHKALADLNAWAERNGWTVVSE